jgi:hypothetical protein
MRHVDLHFFIMVWLVKINGNLWIKIICQLGHIIKLDKKIGHFGQNGQWCLIKWNIKSRWIKTNDTSSQNDQWSIFSQVGHLVKMANVIIVKWGILPYLPLSTIYLPT